jgi:hypothetical protein
MNDGTLFHRRSPVSHGRYDRLKAKLADPCDPVEDNSLISSAALCTPSGTLPVQPMQPMQPKAAL